MHAVYKYPFTPIIEMPRGAKIIRAAMQAGHAYLWAIVNPDMPTVRRTFSTFGTGQAIRELEMLEHVGTIEDGPEIWHIFEVLPR